MRSIVRILISVFSAAIIIQAVMLCAATGWAGFTRFPSPELEKMNESRGLETLFEQAAGHEAAIPRVESRFTFGWLPSGFDASAASVSTIAGPAALIVLLTMILPAGRRN